VIQIQIKRTFLTSYTHLPQHHDTRDRRVENLWQYLFV